MQSDFLYLVEDELVEARDQHPRPMHTPHEAYAVILEELDEFWDKVRAKQHDPRNMLKELVQIAAMCYRAAEDLQLLEAAESEPAHKWCDEHKGKRFRADDPNQEKLGMAINYKCLHGVEWTVTGECLDALRLSQFSHCDCYPVKIPAILKPLNMVDDRTAEQRIYDGDSRPDDEYCGNANCKHLWRTHGISGACKVPGCPCWDLAARVGIS